MRDELKNLDDIVDIHRDELDEKIRKLELEVESIR